MSEMLNKTMLDSWRKYWGADDDDIPDPPPAFVCGFKAAVETLAPVLGGTLRREEIKVATKPKKKCRTCGGFCGKRHGEKCRHGANAAKQQADELWAAVTGRKK